MSSPPCLVVSEEVEHVFHVRLNLHQCLLQLLETQLLEVFFVLVQMTPRCRDMLTPKQSFLHNSEDVRVLVMCASRSAFFSLPALPVWMGQPDFAYALSEAFA